MKYVGIIVAMEEEKKEILNLMTDIIEKNIYNLSFVIGKIEKQDCILIKSGVGKVNAARTTQILINNFNLECIINVGAAGAINSSLNIGDVVVSKHTVQHDFDITAFGHSKGYISEIGDKILCDSNLLMLFKKMFEGKELEYKVKFGIVASGDIFCNDIEMKNKINLKFNADVVDMECAAVAQVCYLSKIPFISVRCISDIPNGNNEITFDENLRLASKRCAEIVNRFIKLQKN